VTRVPTTASVATTASLAASRRVGLDHRHRVVDPPTRGSWNRRRGDGAPVVTTTRRDVRPPTTAQEEQMTDRTPRDDDDHPIVALLPRDWPAQLTTLLVDERISNRVQLSYRVRRLVDDWVLAGADALDALGEAVVTGRVDLLDEVGRDDA
jgi:hypothetical protein